MTTEPTDISQPGPEIISPGKLINLSFTKDELAIQINGLNALIKLVCTTVINSQSPAMQLKESINMLITLNDHIAKLDSEIEPQMKNLD